VKIKVKLLEKYFYKLLFSQKKDGGSSFFEKIYQSNFSYVARQIEITKVLKVFPKKYLGNYIFFVIRASKFKN
jgi:hypothetical protein